MLKIGVSAMFIGVVVGVVVGAETQPAPRLTAVTFGLLGLPGGFEEIDATADQKKACGPILAAMFMNSPSEERKAQLLKEASAILTIAQIKRLHDANWLHNGPMILTGKDGWEELKMTAAQRKQVGAIVLEHMKKGQPMATAVMSGSGTQRKFTLEVSEAQEKADQAMRSKLLAVLTPAQRKHYDEVTRTPLRFLSDYMGRKPASTSAPATQK